MTRALAAPAPSLPSVAAVVELFKPVTWFPPMWAFLCGVVSSGAPLSDRWPLLVGGVILTGPLVCATSQAVNDWFDRDVDAINQPERPVPSGRVPGRWALWIACAWTALSLLVAAALGVWVFAAALLGLALAWAYSAPPLRLKRDGWLGPATCGLAYEGLSWFTGAAVMLQALPSPAVLALVGLYSAGAFGIMTLNDFKAVEGDRATGLRSLPVTLGVERAAQLACVAMALPQAAVVALLFTWDRPWHGAAVAVGLLLQLACMARLLRDPKRLAPWFNATGVTLFVLGMLIAAFAVRDLGAVG